MTVYDTPKSSGGKKKSSKPKPKHHSFLHNAIADVKDATLGIIPGVVALGKAGVHDAGHALGVTGGDYQLDDIGKAIGRQYAAYYSPLVRGHFGEFAQNVQEHPLELALDAGALFTGGGSLAGKVGVQAARASSAESALGRIGAKVAGLDHVKSSRSLADIAETAGKGGVVTRDGKHLVPRARVLDGKLGNASTTLKSSTNPAIRARHAVLDKAVSKLSDTNLALVGKTGKLGHDARIGRAKIKDANRLASHEAAQQAAAFNQAFGKLDKHEKLALRALAAGYEPEQYAQHLGEKLDAGHIDEWDHGRIKTVIKETRHPKVAEATSKYLAGDHSKLDAAIPLAKELSRRNTESIAELTGADAAAMHRARGGLEREIITGKAQGDSLDAAIFSHRSTAKAKDRVNLKNASLDATPAELKTTTGKQFGRGGESRDASILSSTSMRLAKHKAYANVLRDMKDSAVEVGMDDPRLSDAYVTIPKNSPLFDHLTDAQALLEGDAKHAFADDPEGLAQIKEGFGALLEKARATDDGRVLAIPKAQWEAATGGLGPTGSFARGLDKATNAWRTAVLPLRPAWIANNLGQYGIGALSVGPAGLAKGLLEQAGKKGKIVDKYGAHLASSGHVHESVIAAGEVPSVVKKVLKGIPEASTRFNSWLTDSLPRRAVFLDTLNPMVKQLRKDAETHGHAPLTWDAAAEEILKHPEAVDRITQKVVGDLVDFSAMSDLERKYVRRAVPFYSWLRGAAVRGTQLALDDPAKALALQKLSELGLSENQKAYGDLPSYAAGILGLGAAKGDIANAITTQGLNPAATLADEAGMIGSLFGDGARTGGGNPLSNVNPFFKVPIEALQNQTAFSGQKIDKTGSMSILDRIGVDAFQQIPQFSQINKAYGARLDHAPVVGSLFSPPSPNSLYATSEKNQLLAYLGFPRKTIRLGRAHSLAALERSRADGLGSFY